jgi:hypothetical protein
MAGRSSADVQDPRSALPDPLRRAGLTVLMGLSLAAVGCERSETVEWPSEYSLERVGTRPPPAVLESDSLCAVALDGASLTFTGRDSYRSTYRLQRICGVAVELLPDPGVSGTFRISGDSIFFADGSGRSSGTGLVAADSIVISGPAHTLTFRRRAE